MHRSGELTEILIQDPCLEQWRCIGLTIMDRSYARNNSQPQVRWHLPCLAPLIQHSRPDKSLNVIVRQIILLKTLMQKIHAR